MPFVAGESRKSRVPRYHPSVRLDGVTFSLCAIKSENGCIRFTNICRLCRFPRRVEEQYARVDTRGSAILNSRKASGLRSHPSSHSDKSTSRGSEVCAIYINLITRNDVTFDPVASSSNASDTADTVHYLNPSIPCKPDRKTDLRYMIVGKKLLSRPQTCLFDSEQLGFAEILMCPVFDPLTTIARDFRGIHE